MPTRAMAALTLTKPSLVLKALRLSLMQALEAGRRAFLEVFQQGDDGKVLVIQARQHIQRADQLLQAAGHATLQFL